jgi:hypothetical protein
VTLIFALIMPPLPPTASLPDTALYASAPLAPYNSAVISVAPLGTVNVCAAPVNVNTVLDSPSIFIFSRWRLGYSIVKLPLWCKSCVQLPCRRTRKQTSQISRISPIFQRRKSGMAESTLTCMQYAMDDLLRVMTKSDVRMKPDGNADSFHSGCSGIECEAHSIMIVR